MNELREVFSLNFDAHLQGAALLVALAAIGFIVGILTGLFGVGGAFLINPLLIVLMGMRETLVVGSSLTFTIGAAASGTARHWRMKNVEVKTMVILVVGALPAVLVGQLAHVAMRDALGPAFFAAVFRTLYLAVLLVTAWVVYADTGRGGSGESPLQRMRLGPRVDLSGANLKRVSLPGFLLVGGSMGLTNGLLGIGGGVLLVPLLLTVVGLKAHLAVGTSLGVMGFGSIFGTVLYGRTGDVNLLLVMTLLAGSAVGVQIGAWICQQLQAKKLRRRFAHVVLLAAALVAADLAKKLIKA